MAPHDLRLHQIRVLADPVRLQLLWAAVTDPSGEPTHAALTGSTQDHAAAAEHVDALTGAGLLSRLGTGPDARYRPTPDALARFGGALLHTPSTTSHAPGEVDPEHVARLRHITDDLTRRFAATFARETVDRFVSESYELLASRARVRQHLPTLTARFAAERLGALAAGADRTHHPMDDRHSVLFVCVHNSGRSQIAAAALRSTAGDRFRVRTAGSTPAAALDPRVRAELDRRGLGALTEFPRPLTDEVVQAAGTVVTMGCGDACPVLPGRRYLDWPIADPRGRSEVEVTQIIDDITFRVGELIADIDESR